MRRVLRSNAIPSVPATIEMPASYSNVFDEVAIGRILSSPFGFDLTLSSPPRTLGMSLSKSLTTCDAARNSAVFTPAFPVFGGAMFAPLGIMRRPNAPGR